MTSLSDSDLVPLAKWRYVWRVEEYGRPLPERDLERISCLSSSAAQKVSRLLRDAQVFGTFPFNPAVFPEIESYPLIEVDHQDKLQAESRQVKKWLYRRGIPFQRRVLLSYDSDCCVATSWKLLIRYWDLFYYPISDDLAVFDGSLVWCLLFFHEHEMFWGSRIKRANQALQTTPMTRSVCEKTIEFGDPQRGV